jgi:integrase
MTRADARAELGKLVAPLNARAGRAASGPLAVTLRRYVEDEYLVVKGRKWKDSTRGTTEQIIETHILVDFGSRALTSITRRELQAQLDAKAEAGLSFSVVAHVHWQLVSIFAMAEGDGIITVNPTSGLITPGCQGTIDKRTITVENIIRAQMVLEIRERLIFRLAVCEGIRPGEITALQVGDYRQDGMFRIERRIYRGRVDSPKSRRSRRPIPPTETTRRLLEQWMELLPDRSPGAWLFPSEIGTTPLSYSNVYRRRIQPALRTVGLGEVNFQVLRRTWVTEFSEVERDPHVRAQLAGHSVDVHENEYRQAKPAVLKRAMRKLEKRLQ